MVYLIQGTAEQLFQAFGLEWLGEKNTSMPISIMDIMVLDLPKVGFLGTEAQACEYISRWKNNAAREYYLQGNMAGGHLFYLLGDKLPLKKKEECHDEYQKNCVHKAFAFLNDKQEPCGLMVVYRRDDPTQWMLSLIKNNHLAPEDCSVFLLSSSDLAPLLPPAGEEMVVSFVDPLVNSLMESINSAFVCSLMQHVLQADTGTINTNYDRIDLLVRYLSPHKHIHLLDDPHHFESLNLQLLLAKNPTLDLILKYRIRLPAKMLMDCVSSKSGLRKEIEQYHFTSNEQINENLLKMLVVFYQTGVLALNRTLLQNQIINRTLAGSIWDETQINLIPFLIKRNYSMQLFQYILSNEVFYDSVYLLAQMGLLQDVPLFFSNEVKLKELRFIYQIEDVDCKKLCLVFWAKGSLTLFEYKAIVNAAQNYPLLAKSLLALDQSHKCSLKGLKELALEPKKYLKQSLVYHFVDELGLPIASLDKLDESELAALSRSFYVLEHVGLFTVELYNLAVKKTPQGQLLRLLLPGFADIKNIGHREELIHVLYTGIKHGPIRQGKSILAITNPMLLAQAKAVQQRFICTQQMQNLHLEGKLIALAAEQHSPRAERFRRVILKVEEQCNVIHERLRGSNTDSGIIGLWQYEDKAYRARLYRIAYEGITQAVYNLKERIIQEENRVLNIVDPEIKSIIHQSLIVIANIVIALLSFGAANYVKLKSTGNPWFFNQTPSGEELRALDKEIVAIIANPA